eukprot:7128828-Alexandrium_andersonii.AAC.1
MAQQPRPHGVAWGHVNASFAQDDLAEGVHNAADGPNHALCISVALMGVARGLANDHAALALSLIHISEPTRLALI